MILSHRHKFIFLKTRKVAGTSLEIVLTKLCGPDDIITPFGGKDNWDEQDEALRLAFCGRGPQNYNKPIFTCSQKEVLYQIRRRQKIRQYYEHMTAAVLRDRIPPKVWSDYKKFSVIRNPFDFAVSNYHWFRNTGRTNLSFREFLLRYPGPLMVNSEITEIDGISVVDFMLRYENLSEDLAKLSQKLGIDSRICSSFSDVRAKGNFRPKSSVTRQAFDTFPEGVEIVRRACQSTFERYGYDLDPQ